MEQDAGSSDNLALQKILDDFFQTQHNYARKAASRGGPTGDVISALSAIRSALPAVETNCQITAWVPRAISVLQEERRTFRREHQDEAGWGAATFSELVDLLACLPPRD